MKHVSLLVAAMRVSAPLWLWAAHFAFCYVAAAMACDAGWPPSALRWTLAAASAAAIAAAATLLLAACRSSRDAVHRGMAVRVGLLVAGLSLLAIAWTSLPVLLLPACRFA